jgi:hypothetical protein
LKRVFTAAAAAALFCGLPLASPAATPANAAQMAPLAYLLGTWHCTWTAGKDSGSEDQVFETALDGAWLQEKEVVTDRNGKPVVQSIHYTGFDPATKMFMHLGPDADGTYEVASSADANLWKSSDGSFVHTKVSNTQRTMVEADNGAPTPVTMSCKKAQ